MRIESAAPPPCDDCVRRHARSSRRGSVAMPICRGVLRALSRSGVHCKSAAVLEIAPFVPAHKFDDTGRQSGRRIERFSAIALQLHPPARAR